MAVDVGGDELGDDVVARVGAAVLGHRHRVAEDLGRGDRRDRRRSRGRRRPASGWTSRRACAGPPAGRRAARRSPAAGARRRCRRRSRPSPWRSRRRRSSRPTRCSVPCSAPIARGVKPRLMIWRLLVWSGGSWLISMTRWSSTSSRVISGVEPDDRGVLARHEVLRLRHQRDVLVPADRPVAGAALHARARLRRLLDPEDRGVLAQREELRVRHADLVDGRVGRVETRGQVLELCGHVDRFPRGLSIYKNVF